MKYLIYMACCIFLLTSATSCNKFKPDYSGGKAVALKNGQVWVGQGRGTVNNWGIGMDMSFYAYNRFGELRQNLSFRKIPAKGGTYSLFNSNSQLQDSLSGCNFFTISHDGDVLEDVYIVDEAEAASFVTVHSYDEASRLLSGEFRVKLFRDPNDNISNPANPDTIVFEHGQFQVWIEE